MAKSAIRDAGQHTGISRDLPAEASAGGIIGEKLLRALLALAAGNVEVGIEQQRITGCNGVGDGAE